MESTEIIWQELKNLKHGYDDLRQEIANITSKKNEATQTSRRGALTTSGVTAERILKYIYRKEGKEASGKPADKLMLDELISELSERAKPSILPHHVVTHLRTVQAWRNLGGHDKGDFSDVDDDTLIGVNIALNTVVSWFFENYLGGEFAELAHNSEIRTASAETSSNLTDNEKIWQDYFWFANRNPNMRVIEASYLNSLKVKFNLSEDRIKKLKNGYQRKIAEFIELIEQALEDGKMEAFEAEAIEHAREACCVSVTEAKEIITSFLEKIQPALNDSEAHQITWLRDVFESKKERNSIKEEKPRTIEDKSIPLFELEAKAVAIDQPSASIQNGALVDTDNKSQAELMSGDLVCCTQPFQTIIGGSNVLINSAVVFSVDSVDHNRNSITLKEFAGPGKGNNAWLPSGNFTSIFQLPLLENSDLGPQDKIVCCKSESNSADFHSELKKGFLYTVSSVKKDKKLVALAEFPQASVSEKKKWFHFEYFRALEILSKPSAATIKAMQEVSLTVTDAEVEIMMATINGMLKSFRGDKKKWALQFNGHELFSIASGVLSGRIKNSGLKDSIKTYLAKKKGK
jgi:hypothetical protein